MALCTSSSDKFILSIAALQSSRLSYSTKGLVPRYLCKYLKGRCKNPGLICICLDVVKVLLADPTVDPSYDFNTAIVEASSNGHIDVDELLLKDSSVDPEHAIQESNDFWI